MYDMIEQLILHNLLHRKLSLQLHLFSLVPE